MDQYQVVSLLLSSAAFLVSGFTAYKTFLARFKASIYVRPRVILTRINSSPAVVVGCEIINTSPRPGLVDDILLVITFRQSNGRGLDRHTFYPSFMRGDFNINKAYSEADFDVFQSIPIAANNRLVKYIVFNSGSNSFSPSPGSCVVDLRFRLSREKIWRKIENNSVTLEIKSENAKEWGDPLGRSILLETDENYNYRKIHLDNL